VSKGLGNRQTQRVRGSEVPIPHLDTPQQWWRINLPNHPLIRKCTISSGTRCMIPVDAHDSCRARGASPFEASTWQKSFCMHRYNFLFPHSSHGILVRNSFTDRKDVIRGYQFATEGDKMVQIPHPLSALSIDETNAARDIVLESLKGSVLQFRLIYLLELPKAEVVAFLELEHAGKVSDDTPRPARTAQVSYDVIGGPNVAEYHESIVDLGKKKLVGSKIVDQKHQASLVV